jgi:hypothetical protein
VTPPRVPVLGAPAAAAGKHAGAASRLPLLLGLGAIVLVALLLFVYLVVRSQAPPAEPAGEVPPPAAAEAATAARPGS